MPREDTQFKPGQSGNPDGRPKGSGKVAALRNLLAPHAEELVNKAMELALAGDVTALRLCLERLVPPIKLRDEPVCIDGVEGNLNLVEQGQKIIDAMTRGETTPSEAATLMQAISNQARIIEVDDLDRRVTALENR